MVILWEKDEEMKIKKFSYTTLYEQWKSCNTDKIHQTQTHYIIIIVLELITDYYNIPLVWGRKNI